MDLTEDHLLLGTMQRSPGADAPLQGAANARRQIGMASLHLFEDRDGPKPRRRLQHRDDLGIEEIGKWIRTATAPCPLMMRRHPANAVAALIDAFAAATGGTSVWRNFM
jgi:hypothetical protein